MINLLLYSIAIPLFAFAHIHILLSADTPENTCFCSVSGVPQVVPSDDNTIAVAYGAPLTSNIKTAIKLWDIRNVSKPVKTIVHGTGICQIACPERNNLFFLDVAGALHHVPIDAHQEPLLYRSADSGITVMGINNDHIVLGNSANSTIEVLNRWSGLKKQELTNPCDPDVKQFFLTDTQIIAVSTNMIEWKEY